MKIRHRKSRVLALGVVMAAMSIVCARGWAQGPAVTPSTYYRSSHALLIGINRYPKLPGTSQLQFAVRDVNEVGDLLVRRYGFSRRNVTVLTDGEATRVNIEKALAALADTRTVKPEDRILIYFSGHGQTVRLPTGTDMGFLIPSDAEVDLDNPNNASPFLSTCIRMDTLWGYVESAPAKHTLLVADACYAGLLTKSRGGNRKLAPKELASMRAMQVITGGGQGQKTIEDASWGHGAFTYKLLGELRARATTPGEVFTASDLHASLEQSVAALTRGGQTPLLGSYKAEGGEFLFVTTSGPSIPAGKARLSVSTTPPGARVFVDGVEQKGLLTPAEIEIEVKGAAGKRVEIAIELPGHKTAVKAVTVQSGSATDLLPILLAKNSAQDTKSDTIVNSVDGAEMFHIPPGEFLMGDDDNVIVDYIKKIPNNPRHKVMLTGYYLYKNLVTVSQYEQFCRSTGRPMPPTPPFDATWALKDHPMVDVSWYDAMEYCRWASSGNVRVTLPTEAQWEKAARGTDGKLYPWGNSYNIDRVWASRFVKNDVKVTAAVGKFGVGPYGNTDMAGNVWQWCADWYDPGFCGSPAGRSPDPANQGVGEMKARVLRAGSFGDIITDYYRSATRHWMAPDVRFGNGGFRCATSPGENK